MAMGMDQSEVSLPYLQDPMALMQNFPKNYTCTQLGKTFFSYHHSLKECSIRLFM